jgi:putative CocE/NonD family hydrolase
MSDMRNSGKRRWGFRSGCAAVVVAALGFGFVTPSSRAAAGACQEIAVTMSDGVRLDGWFRQAADGGRHPVLWTMTPYGNNACPQALGGIDNDIAEQFNVVRLSYRGFGASEGVSDQWGPQTSKDVAEIGDWIASQPWADGLIPTGASAEGAWITYALQHPAVKAAFWMMSCADALRGCIRTGGQLAGGAFALTAGEFEGYAMGLQQRVANGSATNPTPAEQWAAQAPVAQHAYLDDTYTEFWQQRLGLQYLAGVHAPVMYTTDLYDFVPEGMYVAYENTDPQYRWLNLGFGHNSSTPENTPGTRLHGLVEQPVRRFLEHFGLGVDNGFQNDQRVTMVTNLGTPSGYKRGEVLVRPESDWPLPETAWTRLHLGGDPSGSAHSLNDGGLSSKPSAIAGSDTAPLATTVGPKGELRTEMVVSGASDPTGGGDFGRQMFFDDMRPDEAAALTYTTKPLAGNVELTGPVVVQVDAMATATDFDWQVRLTDVHPDGRSSWISDGQLRASLREIDPARSRRNAQGDIIRPWYTFTQHDPVPIGTPVRYVIELGPTSNVFRAGDRIRVDIQPVAEGYIDSARTAGVGALQVLRGGVHDSSILLPLVPHRCQLGDPGVDGLSVPADCAAAIG